MKKRAPYLDALRVLAIFLVIVNHTNSLVFQRLAPTDATWWLSVVWYYVSKIAVPLFVMVSGACLLNRQDSYRRALGRFARVLIALLVFSYGYWLVELWKTNWTWAQALNLGAFLGDVWQTRATDSFWYLYFYLGLMVMLPLLQRLASAMTRRDGLYLMGMSFGLNAVWPLVAHYVPQAALPEYFDVPLFGAFIGLFFAGHWLHERKRTPSAWLSGAVLAACTAISTWLTHVEYGRVAVGTKYWFMDERTAPSIFMIVGAMAAMLLVKRLFERKEPLSERAAARWQTAGGCAFGAYLLQDLVIAETRYRLFVPVSAAVNPLLTAVVWEIGVFAVAMGMAWLLCKIPLLNKIL